MSRESADMERTREAGYPRSGWRGVRYSPCFIAALALLLLTLLHPAHARETADVHTATIRLDASTRNHGPQAYDYPTPSDLVPWEKWIRAGKDTIFIPEAEPKDIATLAASDGEDHAGVEIRNDSDAPLTARVEVRLPAGIWQVDAALVQYRTPPASSTSPERSLYPVVKPSLWCMEGVWRQSEGVSAKTVVVPPGRALYLRWTETVAAAEDARHNARLACWKSNNGTMQNRVSPALEQVGNTLDVLPELTARGDRDKVVKRVHAALLATAKAQAVWENWREDAASDGDVAFDTLTRALSEISCAASGLTPSQSTVLGEDGQIKAIRLIVVNGGAHTVPLISLGPARRTDGASNPDRSVFRGVAPGSSVSATYPVPSGDEGADRAGLVQFIFGMGTAVVPARPNGP